MLVTLKSAKFRLPKRIHIFLGLTNWLRIETAGKFCSVSRFNHHQPNEIFPFGFDTSQAHIVTFVDQFLLISSLCEKTKIQDLEIGE